MFESLYLKNFLLEQLAITIESYSRRHFAPLASGQSYLSLLGYVLSMAFLNLDFDLLVVFKDDDKLSDCISLILKFYWGLIYI